MESEVVSKRSAASGTPESPLGARASGDSQPSGGGEPTTTEIEKTVSQETPVGQSAIVGEDGSGAFAATSEGQELCRLRASVLSLISTAQAVKRQSPRESAVDDVLADVKAATRALIVAGTAGVAAQDEQKCDCLPCYCVSERCCAFDIKLTHIRALEMQKVLDSVTLDSAIAPWGHMEVRLFASIGGGIGALIPDAFTWVSLRKGPTQGAGLWIPIDRIIGTVQVPKNTTVTKRIELFGTELEVELEQAVPLNRNEEGFGEGTITLNCCVCEILGPTIEVEFTHGGTGGGKIEAKFMARRVC